jgi:FkbM family methyltransferase
MGIARAQCRHGVMAYFPDDHWVGRSLHVYGEFSEAEIESHRMMLKPGDQVICVGAHVGAVVIPVAQMVAPGGKVYAFEPRSDVYELLLENVEANGLDYIVECYNLACSDHEGTLKVKAQDWHQVHSYEVAPEGDIEVPCCKLDTIIGKRGPIKLLQMDVDGHEVEVLNGAEELIKHSRGFIYTENDRKDESGALIAWLVDHEYRMWWHQAPLFTPDNFNDYADDIFGNCYSFNMVCVPEESNVKVKALDEVTNIQLDEQIFDREIVRCHRILERHPNELGVRLLSGHFANLMQREDEAWAAFEENLRRDPEHVGTLAIIGLMRMQRGHYDWDTYELRYRQANTALFGDRQHNGSKWDGSPTDEPVLVWHEQGFGDSIMFGRFLNEAIQRAPNLFVEIQPVLYELFVESFPHIPMIRSARQLPDYRYHCSLPSLPSVLKIGNDVWRPTPYLKAHPHLVEIWQGKNHPRIGLCAKGSPRSERPFTRDIEESLFREVFPLQKPIALENRYGQFYNFAETAALMRDLDLVVTVDTATAHLAGALGVPTWLLLSIDPDWRWGLKSNRTIWYDSVRIFRASKVLDWSDVIEQLKGALHEQGRSSADRQSAGEISRRFVGEGIARQDPQPLAATA